MNFKDDLNSSKNHYSKNWNETSKNYYNLGLYKKLASKIENASNILEVGCGSGYGTFELSKNSKILLSVDENIECLKNTETFLKSENINVQKVLRSDIKLNESFRYFSAKYFPIKSLDGSINLVESNILLDDDLVKYVEKNLKFDYIICWMMGTHQFMLNEINQIKKGRTGEVNLRNRQMVIDYKFEVLEKIGEISNKILSKTGKIYIVERFDLSLMNDNILNETLDLYRNAYEKHGFQLGDNYEKMSIDHDSKIHMVNSEMDKFNPSKIGVLSMIFEKI